ncbi:MAG: hypothetical protein ACRC8S_03540 [Fimbriiglobus sp.]
MAEQVTLTLAKALKLKNRLAGRLAKVDGDLEKYNSVLAGADQPDIQRIYEGRSLLVAQLVELKVAINAANQPAQRSIFRLGEVKSHIALLAKMSTKHGTTVEGYAGTQSQYVAHFRKADVDRIVRELEVDVDRLQEELDAFNYRTMISLDMELLRSIEAVPPVAGG